ncbi:MAG: polysaccharide biosynthesis/export family protein [Acidobacteriota bacterium]|nr:polysaccharide biosynthesis/export family protein [Acidobacteriota bacterium]MDH3784144.1 polysaccharide biosynthesis/export family protein [Acidobacteriota bacterium]
MRVLTRLWFVAMALCAGGIVVTTASAADTPASGSNRSDFQVGIEDVLRIFVYEEPDLSLSVRVRPDGKITVPLINDLHVAGRTPEEIRLQILERLKEFITVPVVTVIVEQINSYRVFFLGEINAQGARQFYSPTRILQGIATAGGLSEFANKKIVLVRERNGGEVRIPVDYKKLVAGDAAQENLFLQPDDMLLFY